MNTRLTPTQKVIERCRQDAEFKKILAIALEVSPFHVAYVNPYILCKKVLPDVNPQHVDWRVVERALVKEEVES